MELTKTIMVVIDPTSKVQPALAQATVIAKKMDLELELLICGYDSHLIEHKDMLDPDLVNQKIDHYLAQQSDVLEQLAKPLRQQNFVVRSNSVWDYPLYEGIIRQALRCDPFLILKDTHFHNKFSRTVLNSNDWSLIRTCPYPLLFVKNDILWSSPKITCSVNPVGKDNNPSQSDKTLVQYGKLFSHELDGELSIYHTYHSIMDLPQTAFAWGGQFNTIFSDEVDQQIRQSHKQALYKLVEESNLSPNSIIMEDGEAKNTLPEYIENSKTDMLIMGTNCSSRFEQVLIGGTTESVLDDVNCDILVIHSDDFETPVSRDYPALLK